MLMVDSQALIDAVNAYHQELNQMKWVAAHTLQAIDFFKNQPDILAIKGCGAMGADVLLLIVQLKDEVSISQNLSAIGWNILATSRDLYEEQALIKK